MNDRAWLGLRMALLVAVLSVGCGYSSSAPDDAGAPDTDAPDAEPDAGPERWRYDDSGGGAHPELICTGLPEWDPLDGEREWQLLDTVNELRCSGPTKCWPRPVPPVTMHPALRCAAREIAIEIATTGTTRVTSGGVYRDPLFLDIVRRWGYPKAGGAQVFAEADGAEEAVATWLEDPDPCDDNRGQVITLVFEPWEDFGGGVLGRVWFAGFAARLR